MRLVVVTGLSGAGKSTALRALEDLGFYCVDNMPLPLMVKFVELLSQAGEAEEAAVVVDAREGDFLLHYDEAFRPLREAGHQVEVLFLDADDGVLVRRFSETRRKHPLGGDDLRAGIVHERTLLSPLRNEAGTVMVDTSRLNVHQLKEVIQERYRKTSDVLGVTLLSFGFRHGLPAEADVVLDVRFLPNPYFVEGMSARSGQEPDVAAFVLENADAREMLDRVAGLVAFLLPRAEREGKAYLTVAVGCTGGRHRSVAMVEALAKRLPERYPLTVRHRDLAKLRE